MRRLLRYTIILFFAIGLQMITFHSLLAQQPVYIPPDGQVFSHPADSVGIFGNMTNEGSLGTSIGSVVNFFGQSWTNSSTSLLPGNNGLPATPGGTFRFMGKQAQNLAAGFNFNSKTGPSFPNVSIENNSGVWLQDLNDLDIRQNLNFNQGYLYLNGWNTLVNQSITGYSDKGFVVTGSAIGGGSLYRKPPSTDTLLVFPVGTDPGSYSPAAMNGMQAFSGVIGATVFDHVYQHATSGTIMDSDFVKKTWQITSGEGVPQTTVLLQHQESDEGIRFSPFRDSSYVSLYQTGIQAWDMDPLPHTIFSPGTLTTGTQYNDTYVNNRLLPTGLPNQSAGLGLDSVNWLAVSTAAFSNTTCPVADFRLWVAQRYNYKWIQLFWRTLRELNVDHYVLQRRLDTSEVYTTIATIPSKSISGFSDHMLYYYFADSANFTQTAYYRLELVSASGCVVFTTVQIVKPRIEVRVWPNPSPGLTHVEIYGTDHDVIMQVADMWGQILGTYTIPSNSVYSVDLSKLQDAVYNFYFRDPLQNYKLIGSVKLVKITVR